MNIFTLSTMNFNLLLRRLILGSTASAVILLFSQNAQAADSVVLKYRILRESVSVTELSTFAKTGELSPSLRAYLAMAKRDPSELRRALTNEVKVNPVLLYAMLTSPIGESILDRVSQVVHTPGNAANRESLRSAIVGAALKDGKISLIEALENYPTPEVQVEGDRLAEVLGQLRKLAERLPKF